MDKKEFIFPGAILGLVLVIAIGLLLTQGRETTPPYTSTSTASSSLASTTTATSTATQAPAPTHYYPYGRVTLGINQAAGFKNGISIRPLKVVTDSRCPTNVECIQAGTVTITLKTSAEGLSTMHTLSVGDFISVAGTSITFTSVAPAKTTSGVSAGAYRFTFTVEPTGVTAQGPCYVGGCSSELCTETKNQVSACIYTDSYACYRSATCARQSDGKCGWTQTPALAKCLANPPTT